MAHQDYVSRSKVSKKKNNPYKNKPASVPTGISTKVKLLAGFLIVALSAFTYFLWSIKDIEPPIQTTPNKTNTAKQKSNELPTPPEEKWQYMEQLKTKEVDEGEYTVKEQGPYKMQCGSFKTRKQAEVMRATIAFSGLSSQVSSAKGTSGTWYKVFLGPYQQKRAAEKDKHKLKSNNINTCQIWLWN